MQETASADYEVQCPCASLADALPHLRRPPAAAAVRFKIQNAADDAAQVAAYVDARLVYNRHRDCSAPRGLLGALAKVGLGLNRQHLAHGRWVVLEVDPVAGAELDQAASDPVQHGLAVLRLANPLLALAHAVEDTREDGVANRPHGVVRTVQVSPPSGDRLMVPSWRAT
jgi:hypothetical protein